MPLLVKSNCFPSKTNKQSSNFSRAIGAASDVTSRTCFPFVHASSSEDSSNKPKGDICTTPSTRKTHNACFFPQDLMDMLSSPFFEDCIKWRYDGEAFFIIDSDKFAEKNSALNSHKSTLRRKSFARKLNRWGFRMVLSKGPNCGSYYHPLFRRDKPWFCKMMRCESRKSNKKFQPNLRKNKVQSKAVKKKKISHEKQEESYRGKHVCEGEFKSQEISIKAQQSANPNHLVDPFFSRKPYSENRTQHVPLGISQFRHSCSNAHNIIMQNAAWALACEKAIHSPW